MAELVDALGSGSSRRTPVRVRVPLAAHNFIFSTEQLQVFNIPSAAFFTNNEALIYLFCWFSLAWALHEASGSRGMNPHGRSDKKRIIPLNYFNYVSKTADNYNEVKQWRRCEQMNNFQKEEILDQMKTAINDITCGDSSIIINLRSVEFSESCRSGLGSSRLAIGSLFVNDDGRVCADMYRTGSGGFFEFICGISIDDIGRRGLDEILYALRNGRWSVSEQPRVQKKPRSRKMAIPLRMPFHLKGA